MLDNNCQNAYSSFQFSGNGKRNNDLDGENNVSCELPSVNNALSFDSYGKSLHERKQSLMQLRSPVNQKLLEDQGYYNKIGHKNAEYVKQNISDSKPIGIVKPDRFDTKPLRIWFTSDQSRRHPKVRIPMRKSLKMNAFKVNSKSKDKISISQSRIKPRESMLSEFKKNEIKFDSAIIIPKKLPVKKVHSHSEPRRNMLNNGN